MTLPYKKLIPFKNFLEITLFYIFIHLLSFSNSMSNSRSGKQFSVKKCKMVSVFRQPDVNTRKVVLSTSQVFTSGYVNTETILHFFYKITNERGTKTVFTYAHAKWFYGQSERAYYFNYFITFNLTRSTPLFLRGDLKFKYVLLFIFHTEFIIG